VRASAAVLLVAALAWVNFHPASYQRIWHTTLTIQLGGAAISGDLRYRVVSGSWCGSWGELEHTRAAWRGPARHSSVLRKPLRTWSTGLRRRERRIDRAGR
jgi:hypothetical protein